MNPKLGRLEIKRVAYGRDDTKLEDREYTLASDISSAVGTIEEWTKVAFQHNYCGVEIIK
jgi:hypothetical protein